MVGALRIAIAEDSAILRDGLVQLLVDRGFISHRRGRGPGRAAQLGGPEPARTWP